jgi:hypothetical protein
MAHVKTAAGGTALEAADIAELAEQTLVELGGLGSRSGEDEGRGGEGEERGELHLCVFCCAQAREVVRRFVCGLVGCARVLLFRAF